MNRKLRYYLFCLVLLSGFLILALPQSTYAADPPGLNESVNWSGPIEPGGSFTVYFEDRNGNRVSSVYDSDPTVYLVIGPPAGLVSNTADCIQYFPPDHQVRVWLFQNKSLGPSGIQRLGPFTTNTGDPLGSYAFRVVLRSRDAGGRIYQSEEVAYLSLQESTTNTPTPSSGDGGTTNNSMLYLLIVVLVAAAGVIVFLVSRKKDVTPAAASYHPATQPAVDYSRSSATIHAESPKPTAVAQLTRANLILPDGKLIQLSETSRIVGRHDFSGVATADNLSLISRQHLIFSYDNGRYYVEDQNSINGTKLNSLEIKGKGKQQLRDGDRIELAGILTLELKNVQ
jgi:hypothetical protein